MAVLLVLSCMLLFQAGSAQGGECPDTKLTDVEHYVDCNYDFHILFHSHQGLVKDINGFWVYFDDQVVTEPGFNKDCVKIRVDDGTWKTVSKVELYDSDSDTEFPDLPDFAPEGASMAVKIWISESIPMDTDVEIWVSCLTCPETVVCEYQDCPPCEVCQEFSVWLSTDQLCTAESDQIVKVTASAGTGGFVMYPPTGDSAAPDFDRYFAFGATPTYLIKGDSYVIDTIYITSLCDNKTRSIVYRNGTVQATYTFDPLQCPYKIRATFLKEPVYAYLKYQLPQSECGDIIKVKVWGSDSDECKDCGYVPVKDKIQPVLNFTDDLYIGGHSAVFDVQGWDSGNVFYTYNSAGSTDGVTSPGEIAEVVVQTKPTTNPETYNVTYTDTAGKTQYAWVTILPNGEWVWAPYMPNDVTDIISIVVQRPAWELVTQNYLDCHKDFEGLIGMVVEVDTGTYKETVEIDTPGVLLKNKEGAFPVIDAIGLTPKGDQLSGKSGAVFLSAGSTGIEGFTIKNSKTNGVLVSLSSPKCSEALIHDSDKGPGCNEETGCKEVECTDKLVRCCLGRVNIVNNDIFNNCENGIYVNNAVVLILNNKIHDNTDDGIDAGCLFCGVETIDPEAITHSPACSEIIYNTIYGNGPSGKGEWEVEKDGKKYFTSDPTACGDLKGWTDAGIQIRCVGDVCGDPCSECHKTGTPPDNIPPCEDNLCAAGKCCTGTCPKPYPTWRDCGGCNMTLYIKYNNVTDNYHAGVYLMKGATQGGNIIIQENQIHENGIFGLLTEAAIPSRIDFKWNDIWCNRYWGVKNLACCDLIAKENYWGHISGPSAGPAPIVDCIECRCHEVDQRSDALGKGEEVSHRVHYNPWLYSPWTCLDGLCGPAMMFGSDSLSLQCGWNTLSVPIKLAPEADTFREIAGLGSFITQDNFVWVLRWDAAADKWVDAGSSGEQIIPGRGYYIKMKEESRFPVLYNAGPSPGLTDIPLESGWNLIGSTWGIDRVNGSSRGDEGRWAIASPDVRDDEAFMRVTDALESIKNGNTGERGVAIIVSPPVSGQIRSWSAPVTTGFWDPLKNQEKMATGEGYWVFMVTPGRYAGFEVTPFYYPTTERGWHK